ncbi:MAG TPA: type II toxin-antitoxin system HicA family toxin [Terriglobales bacterium]|nr:type II toxin-antitoxin system HicA family toxin [Terriglobales bacterium]
MSGLPSVKPDRLIRALEWAGFFVHHASGSHHVLKHPSRPGLRVVVPYHSGDVKRGVLRSILKQAELSAEELLKLL